MAFHVSLGDPDALMASVEAINNGVNAKEMSMDVRTVNGQVVATPHKEEEECVKKSRMR